MKSLLKASTGWFIVGTIALFHETFSSGPTARADVMFWVAMAAATVHLRLEQIEKKLDKRDSEEETEDGHR